ncbi:MAG TPA: c-type cytochrome [Burkholderiaceae bacterium]|nr:c-type cytochrome [Burkholderiaceae bacterium]
MKALLTLTLVAAFAANAAAATAAATPAAKPDLAKGQATAAQVCAACHAHDGSRGSPANPIIAGQHADYLAKQLHEFKTGKRKNPIMMGFAAGLSDADIRNVAAFYASKSAKPGFAKDADLAKLGEKIYRGGLADRAVPACAGCHAPNGVGLPVQYPRVGGQHADYTEAQLVAFRGGARANNPAMAQIAARLSDREIKALADFIAGLR